MNSDQYKSQNQTSLNETHEMVDDDQDVYPKTN